MSKLVGLSWLLFFRATYVASLSLCDASNYLEVKEGRSSTFVCTGLTAQPDVYFYWETSIFLSSCTAASCSNDDYPQYFHFTRINTTSSEVTVYAGTYPDLDYLASTSLSCQQGSAANRVTCQLDVVYPAEDPKCLIEFSGDTWQVTGWCNVSKALSRRNRYACYLYQTSQFSLTLVSNVTMSTRPIAGTVYCQIKTALPPEGKYNYSVIIIPGGVEVFPSFNGSNEIQRPSVSPQHTCPQTVTEGEDVDCVCFSDRLGLPTGYVMWTRTNSSKLKIEKINRSYDGSSNICFLMWNNTAVQTVAYTITVNYAPRVLSFKIDNKADDIVNVRENTNVSVVCQAEGRPLPTIRLFNRSSDNQDVEVAAANNGMELQYTMSTVKCETTASYSCKSENNFSKDQRRILLIVSCAPRQTTQDFYSASFNGGEARLEFKIIAYPPPDELSVFYIGSSLNETTLRNLAYKNTLTFKCISDNVYRYMVTCTVTLLNQTIFSTGVYHAVFSNGLGDILLAFQVNETVHSTGQSNPGVAGQVAGGVIGAVVVIVLAASIVIFIIRRKRIRYESGSQTNPVMTSKTDPQRSLETLYGQLQREDINSPSVYQSLGPQQTSSNFTNNEDEGKSHVYEVPIDLHENTGEIHKKETIYQNKTFT